MTKWNNCCNVADLSLCCIPKNASTSIKRALITSSGKDPDAVPNFHSHPALNRTHPKCAKGLKVAVIRNPVDRAVSNWRNKLWRNGLDNASTRSFLSLGFKMQMSLTDYIQHLPSVINKNAHTIRQAYFLHEQMDVLAPMEKIQDLWDWLKIGRPWLEDLPLLNKTELPQGFKPSGEDISRLQDIYRQDMEIYAAARQEWENS